MIILRQKEFNSKAAKAINEKYLKKVADSFKIRTEIPIYDSKGFRTVEKVDPWFWKKEAREKARIPRSEYKINKKEPSEVDYHINEFNDYIKNKPHFRSASSLDSKGRRPEREIGHFYDHGDSKISFKHKDEKAYRRFLAENANEALKKQKKI